MFRHQMCHPQGLNFVNLPNHISTIAALVKINKIFRTLKFSNVVLLLLLLLLLLSHDVCVVAVYTIRVLMLLLCLPGTFRASICRGQIIYIFIIIELSLVDI